MKQDKAYGKVLTVGAQIVRSFKQKQPQFRRIFLLSLIVYVLAYQYTSATYASFQKSASHLFDVVYNETRWQQVYLIPRVILWFSQYSSSLFGALILLPYLGELKRHRHTLPIAALTVLVVYLWLTKRYLDIYLLLRPEFRSLTILITGAILYFVSTRKKLGILQYVELHQKKITLCLFILLSISTIVFLIYKKTTLFAVSTFTLLFFIILFDLQKNNRIGIWHLLAVAALIITSRIKTLTYTRMWDYSYHLLFAKNIAQIYPNIPHHIELLRNGADFTYPYLSHFLLASAYLTLGERITLFWVGKGVMLVSEIASGFLIYLIAKDMLQSRQAGILAAMSYSFIFDPLDLFSHFSTVVGLPLALSAIFFALRGIDGKSYLNPALSGSFLGLTILTNQIETIGAVILLFFIYSMGRRPGYLLISCAVSAMISAFWWVPILLRYGILTVFSVGQERVVMSVVGYWRILRMMVGMEYVIEVILGSLGILSLVFGLWYAVKTKKRVILFGMFFTILLLTSTTYFKFYFFVESHRYISLFLPLLCVFAGAGLWGILNKRKKDFAFLLLFLLPLTVVNTLTKISAVEDVGRSSSIGNEDITAFFWMRENIERDSLTITDMGHANWLAYESNAKVLNGRRLNEFDPAEYNKDNVVAGIFYKNTDFAVEAMKNYNARYVYYSNSSERPFPIPSAEDYYGPKPSILLWEKVTSNANEKFEKDRRFKEVYTDAGRGDNIKIYELVP